MSEIDKLMSLMTSIDYPVKVYSIHLVKNDFRDAFSAIGTLRGRNTRDYSCTGNTSLDALRELDSMLRSLVCPTCDQLRDSP